MPLLIYSVCDVTTLDGSVGQVDGGAATGFLESEGGAAVASVDVNAWIPEQWGGALVKKYRETSGLLRATEGGRREVMTTTLKHVPKDADADMAWVAKGAAFPVDDEPADNILLHAKKMAVDIPLDDEDVQDGRSFTDVTGNKRNAAFNSAAWLLDNTAFATVGAETTPPTMTRPFTSVYQAIGGAASAQRFSFDKAGGTDAEFRAAIKNAIQVAEESPWATDDIVIVASPAFKSYFRDQVQDGSNGVTLWNQERDTVLGYPVYWSRALRLSTTATWNPTGAGGAAGTAGNPILVAVPRTMLIPGIRENLKWRVSDPDTGIGMLTDTWHLTVKQRVAFALGDAEAAGVAEIINVP